jgi:hypothetical protein
MGILTANISALDNNLSVPVSNGDYTIKNKTHFYSSEKLELLNHII